jgi:hypothetical protein
MFLAQNNWSGTSRGLGITLLVYGALDLASLLLTRGYVSPQLRFSGIPATLQAWLVQVFNDFLSPALMFTAGLLVWVLFLSWLRFSSRIKRQIKSVQTLASGIILRSLPHTQSYR